MDFFSRKQKKGPLRKGARKNEIKLQKRAIRGAGWGFSERAEE